MYADGVQSAKTIIAGVCICMCVCMCAGNWNYDVVVVRRLMYNTTQASQWVTVDGLVPNSQYNVQVNASNTKGFILTNSLLVQLPMGCESLQHTCYLLPVDLPWVGKIAKESTYQMPVSIHVDCWYC